MSELVEGAGESPSESPPVRSVGSWKIWLLRIVLASLVAAAPLIIVPDGSILMLVSVIGGSILAFLTVCFLNAQYLPALNIAITPGLLQIFYFQQISVLIPTFRLMVIVIVIFQIMWLTLVIGVSRHEIKTLGWKIPAVAVLYTAIPVYALFNATLIAVLPELLVWGTSNQMRFSNFMLVIGGLMLVLNLYWAGTSRGETLDRHPGLGLLMEATVIVIPFTALFAFLRYI